MDWTTLLSAQQADFIQILNIRQRLAKFALCILLALIISMTGIVIPGVTITTTGIAEALTVKRGLSPFQIRNTVRTLGKAGRFIASSSSFLPDISLLRATLAPTFAPTFTPTFSPIFTPNLSLFRLNFYLEFKEFNLVKVIKDQDSRPSAAVELYKQGVEKSKKGDYRGAVKHYSDALSKDGNFAEAYVSRGRAYSELGTQQAESEYYQRAIADYTKSLEVKAKFAEDQKRYVEPLIGRGTVYIKQGKYQESLDDFSLAIQRNPDFYDAYLGRATIYIERQDYQKALQDLNEALNRNLEYPAAFLMRGSILGELGGDGKAIADFKEVIESHEQDASNYYADAYYKQGLAYLNLGEN
ncbi:MAG: tetratricopeptide repeat protein [Stigonema ocellatum SAG 48.90 = DSM 106950]|nr:tetratricopeptide repeat protein [Stigonema ocellatum SAG 48.90 = DSM 106950]